MTRLSMSVMLCASLAAWSSPRALAAGDSLCVHFSGTVAGERAALTHRYTLGGILPATICNLEPTARYRLVVDGEGLERRIGAFSVGTGRGGAVHGVQFSVISRNAVLPGWGSVYACRGAAGASDDVGLAASLSLLYGEDREYRHLKVRLDEQTRRLAEATTDVDRQRFQVAAHEASRELNIQNDHRRWLAMVAGGIYAWQIVEPLLVDNPPAWSSGQEGHGLTLRGTGQSRAKACFFSLVRPGRGQFYQGKAVRGVLFSVAAVGVGLTALHYESEYDFALDDYNVCIERFNATDVLSEKELLRDEASRLWSGVERAKDRRNASLIALAGLWSWNVIDTFFPGGEGDSVGRRYSFDLDAQGASLAFRF